ncbi:MAG: hypothetical protein CL535_16635 [Ahrensia sp.]|nr:hypothetical protein [Ahrensia sp.]MBV48203.1 hypothetical protein [Roseobacter sp.]MBV48304.1 hypothetical protein [Roseobacter sp.]|tara:strand:+ start:30107 stop:30400 length:294 start_codon:yes stop_codon:yes gene_type:complete
MNRRKFLAAIGLAPIAATVPVAAKAAAVTGEFGPEAMMPLYDKQLASRAMCAEAEVDILDDGTKRIVRTTDFEDHWRKFEEEAANIVLDAYRAGRRI